MMVKVLFVLVIILFSLVSFFVDLPPGILVSDWFNVSSIEFVLVSNNLFNGFFYGGIIGFVVFLFKRGARSKRRRFKSYSRKGVSDLDRDVEKLLRDTKDYGDLRVVSDLVEIDGIGKKRAEELMFAGVRSVYDLSKRSPKHLAKKTGISLRSISKWIVNANEIMKNRR